MKGVPVPQCKEQTIQELCNKFDHFNKQIAILAFGAEDKNQLTFKELLKLIRGLAAGLSKAGLEKHETVMLFANNSPDFIIAALAVIYAGGVCVPIDLQSDDEVLNHIIEDSEAKRIFVDAKGWERLQQLHKTKHMQVIRLDNENESDNWRKLLVKNGIDSNEPIKAEDQAVLFYTSGTTGLPKGVPLTHANIMVQLDAVQKTQLIKQTDKVLLPLPLFHVYPFCDGLLVPFYMGITVILPKAITGPEIIRAIKEGKATVLVAVPRLLRALYAAIETKARSNNMDSTAFDIAHNLSNLLNICLGLNIGKLLFQKLHKRFPTLRLLACGGALLDPDLAHKLTALGWQTAVGYGLTETAPLLTIRMPGNRDLKSVGKPIPGVQVRILKVADTTQENNDSEKNGKYQKKDRKNKKVEKEAEESLGEQPEIQVKGQNVFAGYRNLPERTAETFTEDGWFKTGDTGYMMLGNLHVTGRISITIKSEGGKKIQPEEVEKEYTGDPVIREVGILQDKQKLVALVVHNVTVIGHNDPRSKIAEAIKKKSETLPSYYRVTDFAISKELLPRTNLGKIRRGELVKYYEKAKAEEKAGKAGKSSHKEEMSSEDKTLLAEPIAKASWDWLNEKFPDAEITLDKSPQLDLNVDSLEWLNLTLEIQERFGVELNEEAIAQIDTVRDLIKAIVDAAHSGDNTVSPFEKPEQFIDDSQKEWLKPLNPFMLSLARLLYWSNFYLMRICFKISAEGLEKIPKGQVIFTPNHASYLDPFAIAAILDFNRMHKTQWAGWAGIALNNPFNAFIYRLAQAIPIEAKRSLISSLALAAAVLKNKKSLVWFPEGERTLTGKLLPFKSGIGTLLQHFEVKVVPVRLVGTREALPPGAFFPRLKKITVIFGEPILPEQLLKEGSGNNDAERIANCLHDKVNELHALRKK